MTYATLGIVTEDSAIFVANITYAKVHSNKQLQPLCDIQLEHLSKKFMCVSIHEEKTKGQTLLHIL